MAISNEIHTTEEANWLTDEIASLLKTHKPDYVYSHHRNLAVMCKTLSEVGLGGAFVQNVGCNVVNLVRNIGENYEQELTDFLKVIKDFW